MFFQGEGFYCPPASLWTSGQDGPTVKHFILSWQTRLWLPPAARVSEGAGEAKTPEVFGLAGPSRQPHWQPVIFHRRLAELASRNMFGLGAVAILFAPIQVNAPPPSQGPPWKAGEPPSLGF